MSHLRSQEDRARRSSAAGSPAPSSVPSAGLARDGVDVERLRRWGFESAARDPGILAGTTAATRSSCHSAGLKIRISRATAGCSPPSCSPGRPRSRAAASPASESFSETYLYFFNLLEKARETLDDVRRIAARKESLDGDTLRQGLSQEVMGLADGGEWEWAFNLIEKYGLVPSNRMPETASSKSTDGAPGRPARALRAGRPGDPEQAGELRCDSRAGAARRGPHPRRSPGHPAAAREARAGGRCRPPSMPSRSSASAPASGGW